MPLDEIRKKLSWSISLAARLQRTRFDERVRAMGMTLAQWRALDAIGREEGATQRRIAEMLEVGDVTASRLIDRLVEKKWITRRPDPDDRRAHRLSLTATAEPLLAQLGVVSAQVQEMVFAGLDEEEMAQLQQLLATVITNLEADGQTEGRRCKQAELTNLVDQP